MAKNTALAAYKAGVKSRVKHHKRVKTRISLAIIAGLAPTAMYAYKGFKDGATPGPVEASARLVARLTGYSITEDRWKYHELVSGWWPILMGVGIHKLANKFGVNRALRSIPYIQI